MVGCIYCLNGNQLDILLTLGGQSHLSPIVMKISPPLRSLRTLCWPKDVSTGKAIVDGDRSALWCSIFGLVKASVKLHACQLKRF